VDTTRVEATSPGGFAVVAGGRVVAEAPGDVNWTFTADADGRLLGASASGRVGPVQPPLELRPRAGAGVVLGGRPYRGAAVLLSSTAGRVTAVNVVELEDYLLGVVPAEIPSLHIEAVKAQAIAARTYAIGNLDRRARLGFDFFATVSDQVYGGVAREDTMASRAVRETAGEIITYEGAPILAYYHSTCGGRTAAIDEVWRRAPLPYLVSISDARPDGQGHYCEASNRFDWREQWDGAELADILLPHLAEFFGRSTAELRPLRDLAIEERTPSGRVQLLRIDAGAASYRIRGDSIRWFLRPEPDRILNSVLFDMTAAVDDGRVRALSVAGHGWGHGIGMCQMGAIGRARAGHDYRRILAAYYRGTQVTKLY
ncbi:MAG: SpoIID/LytB domain-containing protein, partial [Longimicrobiales bacterium]